MIVLLGMAVGDDGSFAPMETKPPTRAAPFRRRSEANPLTPRDERPNERTYVPKTNTPSSLVARAIRNTRSTVQPARTRISRLRSSDSSKATTRTSASDDVCGDAGASSHATAAAAASSSSFRRLAPWRERGRDSGLFDACVGVHLCVGAGGSASPPQRGARNA